MIVSLFIFRVMANDPARKFSILSKKIINLNTAKCRKDLETLNLESCKDLKEKQSKNFNIHELKFQHKIYKKAKLNSKSKHSVQINQ